MHAGSVVAAQPVAGYRTADTGFDGANGGPTVSASQLFSQVDRLFDGTEMDRERAVELLQANEHKVTVQIRYFSINYMHSCTRGTSMNRMNSTTSNIRYSPLERCFYLLGKLINFHFRFTRPPYLFPVKVDRDIRFNVCAAD